VFQGCSIHRLNAQARPLLCRKRLLKTKLKPDWAPLPNSGFFGARRIGGTASHRHRRSVKLRCARFRFQRRQGQISGRKLDEARELAPPLDRVHRRRPLPRFCGAAAAGRRTVMASSAVCCETVITQAVL
jgi:hypothetical protein